MERIIKNKTKVLFVLLILGMISACKEPTDLLNKLEDDVKSANDLYLEIVSITPSENATDVNPGESIRIEFDRAIDLETFEENFRLQDSAGLDFVSDSFGRDLEYSFNEDTNIMTITAEPFLEGLADYKLDILNGLEGQDGSSLREGKSVNFGTSDAPRGSIIVQSDYTNETTVDVKLTTRGATYYILSTTESGLSGDEWKPITSGEMIVEDFMFTSSRENDPGTEKTLYARFRDGDVNESGSATKSNIETDTVVYDTLPPGISFPENTVYSKNSTSASIGASVSDNSGIKGYIWADPEDDSLAFGDEYTLNTSVFKGSDGNYIMTLTATDGAGNEGTETLSYIVDTIDPEIVGLDNSTEIFTPSDTAVPISYDVNETSGVASYRWEVLGSSQYSMEDSTSKVPTLRVLEEVVYQLKLTVTDKCGNSSNVTIDLNCNDSAPIVSLPKSIFYQNADGDLGNITATVDWGGGTAGDIEWTSDTVTFGSSTSATTSVTASEGSHKIKVTATNGPYSASASADLIWDLHAPVISLSSSTLYANSTNTQPTISASASDGLSGISSYKWTGTGIEYEYSTKSATAIRMDGDGNYTATLTVTDKAGNSDSADRPVTKDTVAPGIPSFTVTTPTSSTSSTFSNLTAGSGGLGYFRYRINEGTAYTIGSAISKTLSLPYGGTKVEFACKDTAGNWSSYRSITVAVYPAAYYPSNGTLITSHDLAWKYDSRYWYKVFYGVDTSSFDNFIELGGYRSPANPYIDNSELPTPLSTTTYYWFVKLYTATYVGGKVGYVFSEAGILPKQDLIRGVDAYSFAKKGTLFK